jgi:hypothetical protein
VFLPKPKKPLQQYKILVPVVGDISVSAVVKADVCETRTILTNDYSVFEEDQKYTVAFEGEKEGDIESTTAARVASLKNTTAATVASTKASIADMQKQMAVKDVGQAGPSVGVHEQLSKAKEVLREAEVEQERLSLWPVWEAKSESGGWQIQSEKLKFDIECKASEPWYDVITVVEGKTLTPQSQAGRIGLERPLQDGQRLFMSKHKRDKLEHNLNNKRADHNDCKNAIVRNVTTLGKCEVEYIADGEKKDASSSLNADKLPTNVVEVSKIYELNTGLKDLLVKDIKLTQVPHYNLEDHVLELGTPLAPPLSVGCWLHWPPNTTDKEPLIVLFSSCKNKKVKDWVVVERSTGLIGMIDKDIEIGTDFKPVTKVCGPFMRVRSYSMLVLILFLPNSSLRLLSLLGGILLASPCQTQIRRQMSTKGKFKANRRRKNMRWHG